MTPIQRSFSVIRHNKGSYLPRYLIAFDTETLPKQTDNNGRRFSHTFRLATATIGRIRGTEVTSVQRKQFTSQEQFWVWIKSVTASNYTTWIVSHNALFDLIVIGLMSRLEKAELVIEWPRSKRQKAMPNGSLESSSAMAVIESPPTILACKIVETYARVVFLDSLNWFPVSLREMGERIKMPKEPMPDFSESDAIWFHYCQRDSDILFYTFAELIKWVKDNDLGVFRYTAPSQAMSAYRHRFMNHKIYVHDNMDVKRLERAAYFGGRTEVFRRCVINEPVYQLDVNSLFPSVMQSGQFPCVLDRYELRDEYLELLPAINWRKSVASVVIRTLNSTLPMRTKFGVIYPSGQFSTVLCGHELDYAAVNGMIVKVGSWAEYRLAPLFSDWVNHLYRLRLYHANCGDNLYANFTKTLLNGLYGKFGERAPKWVNVHNDRSGLPWTTWVEANMATDESTEYRMFGWQLQRKTEGEETLKSFVAIPAFVTSAARIRMNVLRSIAGKQQVYYQGCDSLIVTQVGYDNLVRAKEIDDKALGKMRLVATATDGEIIGCSDYRLGDRIVIAGRSRVMQPDENGVMLQHKFHAKSNIFRGVAANDITEELCEWQRSDVVRKGTVGNDGWISPFVLNREE